MYQEDEESAGNSSVEDVYSDCSSVIDCSHFSLSHRIYTNAYTISIDIYSLPRTKSLE